MNNVTILIPTTNVDAANKIVNSYLISKSFNLLYVQFVFLINPKKIIFMNSKWEKFKSYELISIYADRYFGSCEENIYRSQDFSSCFQDYIFCIGDGDEINWDLLVKALSYVSENSLDACAWNIMHRQTHKDLGFSEEKSISLLEINSSANKFIKLLFNGDILPAGIGFLSLLSTFGPVDWAAFLGNHLFRRNVFESILSNRSQEYIYSFVFKQLEYFTKNPNARYGFINQPIITRIADEFVDFQNNSNVKKISWLEEHRLVEGGTPIFWIAILDHLNSIDKEEVFDLVINSFMYSHRPNEKYEIYINYHPTLTQLLNWARSALNYKIKGNSHYLGKKVKSSSFFEIIYIFVFLKKLKGSLDKMSPDNDLIKNSINHSIICLELYLKDTEKFESLIIEAKDSITNLINHLNESILIDFHLKSFNNYLNSEFIY